MRRDVRDVVVEDGLERIKAELTLEHLVVSRVVEDAVELLRGGDELHIAACSVRSLELAPRLLVDLALVLVLNWNSNPRPSDRYSEELALSEYLL